MRNIDLLTEAAALGGYEIGTTGTGAGQPAYNKARAQRRVTVVKSDIISRFGGHWESSYREGWLALVPNYTTGTVSVTQGSNTVTGSGTGWNSAFKSRKFIGPDGATYKIASIATVTSMILSSPYQGESVSGQAYAIWKDEYRLYPEVLSIGGFTNYQLTGTMSEALAKNMKASFPHESANQQPDIYTIIGRENLTATYSTGTLSGTINTNILTGASTAWLANLEPGYQITVGTNKYTVKKVNSDTEIELYQLLVATVAALTTYSAVGKNAIIVRFKSPSSQQIVSYWYYAKDYPFVNDEDEDWVAEMYANVIISGLGYWDFVDKNDGLRSQLSKAAYENAIKDMRVAVLQSFTGNRTLGIDIPDSARE
jgi:hypothetical protein